MGQIWKWAGVCCVASLLWGCDGQRIQALEEGVATEADVRREFGVPDNIWDGPAGARIFEFNRQPAGQRNYMITVGTDGKMTALRQVLTPENFARITPGMAMEDVRKTLGKPARTTPYALKNEVEYDWRYVAPNNTAMLFTVTFNTDYRVLRTASVPDPSAEPQRSGS